MINSTTYTIPNEEWNCFTSHSFSVYNLTWRSYGIHCISFVRRKFSCVWNTVSWTFKSLACCLGWVVLVLVCLIGLISQSTMKIDRSRMMILKKLKVSMWSLKQFKILLQISIKFILVNDGDSKEDQQEVKKHKRSLQKLKDRKGWKSWKKTSCTSGLGRWFGPSNRFTGLDRMPIWTSCLSFSGSVE